MLQSPQTTHFNQDITTYRFVYRLAAGVGDATSIKYLEMA